MHPDTLKAQQLCEYLKPHQDRQVTLQELGKLVLLSTFATQRLFQRVTGVSPRAYQLGLRSSGLREELAGMPATGRAITDAIYNAGYGTSSRVYEETGRTLGMKPSQYRNGGTGEVIDCAIVRCPEPNSLGHLIVAMTSRGLCHVALGDDPLLLAAELKKRFGKAVIHMATPDDHQSPISQAIQPVLSLLTEHPASVDLPLDLRATAFQQRVWRALRAIPRGQTRSYRDIAAAISQPSAARAVARACASNSLALVIPCHRVIGADGDLRG